MSPDTRRDRPAHQPRLALQSEDANPNLVIIDPKSHDRTQYSFGPTLHGGGYDELVFRGCKIYISASNPANDANTGPAIVTAQLQGNMVKIAPCLAGEASAVGIRWIRAFNSTFRFRTR